MSNSLVPANMGGVSTVFAPQAGQKYADDLAGGVQSSFAVVSFRGKDWRVKYRGDEAMVTNSDGENVRSLKVVIIKGNSALSKIYYKKNYAAGDDGAPDCYSINGVRPEPDSQDKQNDLCGTCQWNKFGSRITENGKKAKACSDNRRLAVVPLEDMDNEVFGGPMLLRVPPASLADMATFTQKMQALGYPYFSIAIRLGFTDDAFPKLTFGAIRALTDDEAKKVLELRDDDRVDYMLHQSRASDEAPAPVKHEEKVAAAFEEGFQPAPAAAAAKAAEKPAEADTALMNAMDGVDTSDSPAATKEVEATKPEPEQKTEAPKTATKPGPRQKASEPKAEAKAEPPAATPSDKPVADDGDLDDILNGLLPD